MRALQGFMIICIFILSEAAVIRYGGSELVFNTRSKSVKLADRWWRESSDESFVFDGNYIRTSETSLRFCARNLHDDTMAVALSAREGVKVIFEHGRYFKIYKNDRDYYLMRDISAKGLYWRVDGSGARFLRDIEFLWHILPNDMLSIIPGCRYFQEFAWPAGKYHYLVEGSSLYFDQAVGLSDTCPKNMDESSAILDFNKGRISFRNGLHLNFLITALGSEFFFDRRSWAELIPFPCQGELRIIHAHGCVFYALVISSDELKSYLTLKRVDWIFGPKSSFDRSIIFLDQKTNNIYTQNGKRRTELIVRDRLYTVHGSKYEIYISNDGMISLKPDKGLRKVESFENVDGIWKCSTTYKVYRLVEIKFCGMLTFIPDSNVIRSGMGTGFRGIQDDARGLGCANKDSFLSDACLPKYRYFKYIRSQLEQIALVLVIISGVVLYVLANKDLSELFSRFLNAQM